MCGIVGYIGPGEAVPVIIDSLKRLEYRGYDSAVTARRPASSPISATSDCYGTRSNSWNVPNEL